MAADFHRIVIAGLGAIGGSLGLALKRARYGVRLVGVDSEDTLRRALKMGVIDEAFSSWTEGIAGADYVIIDVPHEETEDLFAKIIRELPDGVVISDMAPIRRSVCGIVASEVRRELDDIHRREVPREICHIGLHPLIQPLPGGLDGAHPDLLNQIPVLLTPTRRKDVEAYERVKHLVEEIGAHAFGMTPEAHDKLFAECRQLPSIIVMAYLRHLFRSDSEKRLHMEILDCNILKHFQELTELNGFWCEALSANREDLIPVIRSFAEQLNSIAEALANGKMEAEVEAGKQRAQQILENRGSCARIPSLWVSLPDDSASLSHVAEILTQARIIVDDVKKVKKDNGQNVWIAFKKEDDAGLALKRLKASGFVVRKKN